MFRDRRQFDSWIGKPEVCRVQLSRKRVQAPSSAFTEQAPFGNKRSDGFISVDKTLRMKRERGEGEATSHRIRGCPRNCER